MRAYFVCLLAVVFLVIAVHHAISAAKGWARHVDFVNEQRAELGASKRHSVGYMTNHQLVALMCMVTAVPLAFVASEMLWQRRLKSVTATADEGWPGAVIKKVLPSSGRSPLIEAVYVPLSS